MTIRAAENGFQLIVAPRFRYLRSSMPALPPKPMHLRNCSTISDFRKFRYSPSQRGHGRQRSLPLAIQIVASHFFCWSLLKPCRPAFATTVDLS